MKHLINPRFVTIILMILTLATIRYMNIAHQNIFSEYSPIGAICIFGAAYFDNRWKAIIFPIVILFISDLIINLFFYNGQYGIMQSNWILYYLIFAMIVLISRQILQKINFKNVLLASFATAIGHWVLSDSLVFIGGGVDISTMLPLTRDWAGYLQCIMQGLPFAKNFLVGTLVYSAVMFGAFELLQMKFPRLSAA
jgi:hypothetical protein